jgi:VIT1/CCC1 family predicted Fe2+/Mn2+ transporter
MLIDSAMDGIRRIMCTLTQKQESSLRGIVVLIMRVIVVLAFVFFVIAVINTKYFPKSHVKRPKLTFALYLVTVILGLIATVYNFYFDT